VDVEEVRSTLHPSDLTGDALDVAERGFAIEMNAEDVHACAGQRQADRLTEPGGGTEDQSPAFETDRSVAAHDAQSSIHIGGVVEFATPCRRRPASSSSATRSFPARSRTRTPPTCVTSCASWAWRCTASRSSPTRSR